MTRRIIFMTNEKSLISLALIKTNWEESQKDYVDIIIPFVLYSISDLKNGDIVSIANTRQKLEQEFGIDIYNNVIETFFKRLASKNRYKSPYIYKEKGVYYRSDQIIDTTNFERNRTIYQNNHNQVVECFINFLKSKKILFNPSSAKEELIAYLCKYGHNILKYEFKKDNTTIWTKRVGEFIEWSYNYNENIFSYLEDIAKGGMLSTVYFNNNSNKDVKISQRFKNTEIYFDTPLLMFVLNYSGEVMQKTVQELVDLLHEHGAEVCTFEHNLIELQDILDAYIKRYRQGTLNTSYNFDYLIENDVKPEKIESDIPSLRYMLKSKKIFVKETPTYDDYWRNIGTLNFNNYLSEKIHYRRDDRRDNDVASIAAIYRLRDRDEYHKYETCKALFVATNNYLVYHTQKYFREEEQKRGIPAIVDDTFLTSLLWLKSIKKDVKLPTLKLVADALAAQEPSKEFWSNFIVKVDELRERNEITEDELIELKYGLFSKKNMFDVTEGDSNKITHETVKEVQLMNFRMQHKEVIEEKEKITDEKNVAIKEKNEYQKKYSDTHDELIRVKSQPYIQKIKRIKGLYNILALACVSIIIYFIVDLVTHVSGFLSKTNYVINIGATTIVMAVFGVINLVIDKHFTNQADKVFLRFMNSYLQKTYNTIQLKENEDASDIIVFIKETLKNI